MFQDHFKAMRLETKRFSHLSGVALNLLDKTLVLGCQLCLSYAYQDIYRVF